MAKWSITVTLTVEDQEYNETELRLHLAAAYNVPFDYVMTSVPSTSQGGRALGDVSPGSPFSSRQPRQLAGPVGMSVVISPPYSSLSNSDIATSTATAPEVCVQGILVAISSECGDLVRRHVDDVKVPHPRAART